MERRSLLAISVGALALAVACAQNPESPVSPSAATGSAAANADGSTLKVSAPEPVSPGEGERTETVRPTIVFRNSAGRFTSVALSYRVQVFDASGNAIAELGVAQDASGQTSLTADTDLAYDTEYRWRVRAEYQGQAGPWSALRPAEVPRARHARTGRRRGWLRRTSVSGGQSTAWRSSSTGPPTPRGRSSKA